MANETPTKAKKILSIVGNTLIWIFVVFSMLITVLVFTAQSNSDGVPAIFGKSLITVETDSMNPTYMVGDMVFMTKLSDEEKTDLKPGVIITYHAPIDINGDGKIGDINTHRIETIDANGIIVTKGDGNLIKDNEGDTPYTIHYNDVIGTCTENGKLPGVGNAIKFLRSSLGFFLFIVLPLVAFFIYELYRFIALLLEERAKKNPQPAGISAADEEEIKRRAIEEYLKAQQANAEAAEPSDDNKAE